MSVGNEPAVERKKDGPIRNRMAPQMCKLQPWVKPTETMTPDVLPTPQGLNVVCHRLTTKRFDPCGVGRGLGWRVAVRGFHPRLMILFPFGELGSGVIVSPRLNPLRKLPERKPGKRHLGCPRSCYRFIFSPTSLKVTIS